MDCGKVILSAFRAHRALNSARRNKNDRRHENRVYYCRHCNGHHLTSDVEKERTARIKIRRLKEKAKTKE